jgi:hypothetical protein
MADAVLSHLKAVGCSAARLGGKQAEHVVIMAGDALAATLEFTAPLKPSPQTVKDHHLVPKGAAGIDGGYIADVKIVACKIVRERCSALEKQARATGFKAVEEGVEGPAYPEVFLDVLFCGAEPVGSREKQIAAFALACRQYSLKSLCHC